eukprot:1577824-Rhodomonas_salina.3
MALPLGSTLKKQPGRLRTLLRTSRYPTCNRPGYRSAIDGSQAPMCANPCSRGRGANESTHPMRMTRMTNGPRRCETERRRSIRSHSRKTAATQQ